MSVTVLNAPAFRRAVSRAADQMRSDGVDAAALALGEAMIEVSETVPLDSGRLSAAYGSAAAQLGAPGGNSAGAVPGDATVEINDDGQVVVTIATPYAVFIELGTSLIAPGLQLATALENVRRRVIFGRGPGSIRGALAAGFSKHIGGG